MTELAKAVLTISKMYCIFSFALQRMYAAYLGKAQVRFTFTALKVAVLPCNTELGYHTLNNQQQQLQPCPLAEIDCMNQMTLYNTGEK